MNYKKVNHYLELEIDGTLANKTILEVLEYYHISKKNIHTLRMSHDIFHNDEMVNQNFHQNLHVNDILKLPIFQDEKRDFIPQNIPLDIVYEDEFLLIVNKPPFIMVHPDHKSGINTLANAVSYYYQKTNQYHRIRYIHRLDTLTSGLVVFVKNFFVHNLYDDLLKEKKIKRLYLALTTQKPPKDKGYITYKIGKDRHHKQKRIISTTGDEAKTFYRVIKHDKKTTLVELELFTGRTHQIRVHLNAIKSPILGDTLYGKPSSLINRQALHAYKLLLLHPVTLIPFEIEIALPNDIKEIINRPIK